MGNLIINASMTLNGAFDEPSPETWLEVDTDSGDAGLEQLKLADALVLGRKTYEGLAAVWPMLGEDPYLGRYAPRINDMPKYVASRTLTMPLDWNAQLIEGELDHAIAELKAKHDGNLIVSGIGEFATELSKHGLIDEFWFWVNPHIWPTGPRILDAVGPIRLQLVSSSAYQSGVLWLRYRPASS